MNVLALECSGKALSVALKTGEGIREMTVDAGFRHGETLMPAVDALLGLSGTVPADLDLVACSAGPGSFTALRIGMATAKGIARGAGCPVKAVPTLPLLARGRENWPGPVAPVMDARKQRVYAAAFRGGERLMDDADIALDAFFASIPGDEPVLVTGPDAAIASGYDRAVIDPLCGVGRAVFLIEAAVEAFEAHGADPPDAGPVYIRLSEAEENLTKGP